MTNLSPKVNLLRAVQPSNISYMDLTWDVSKEES
jgi:hypothetical protein